MKKLAALFLAMTMVLSGCGSQSGGNTSGGGSSGETASSDKPVTLTAIVAGLTEDSPSGEALKKFAELCSEYSGGTVTVDCYFNTELGSVASCVDACKQGTIDIVSTGTSYFSGIVPDIQVFELPFLFDTYDEVHDALDNEPGDLLKDMFDGTGIKLLCYWESGMRHVTNSRGPINTPADMKGLKIRTVVSETQTATWEAFGAIPMALDMGEVFTALQQGTVDAQENALSSIASQKMYEVQDYLSMTYHSYTAMPFFVNQSSWDKLSADQQSAVQKASEESRDLERQLNADSEKVNLKLLEDNGVEVNYEPDRASFAALVGPVYELFTTRLGNDTALKTTQDYLASIR